MSLDYSLGDPEFELSGEGGRLSDANFHQPLLSLACDELPLILVVREGFLENIEG